MQPEQNVEISSNTLPKASFRLGEKTNYYSKDAPKKTAVVSSAKAEENEGKCRLEMSIALAQVYLKMFFEHQVGLI